MQSLAILSLLLTAAPGLGQIIITRTIPPAQTSCALTRCVDYVNTCQQTYGGCYRACSGDPIPSFTDPYDCTKTTTLPVSTTSTSPTSTKPTSTSTSTKPTSTSTSTKPTSTSTSSKPTSTSSTTSSTSTKTSTSSPTTTKPTSTTSSSVTSKTSSTLITTTKSSSSSTAPPSTTSSAPAPSGTLVPPNLQCGGIGITGQLQCTEGYYCQQVNAFFWQCQPLDGEGGFPDWPGDDPPPGGAPTAI